MTTIKRLITCLVLSVSSACADTPTRSNPGSTPTPTPIPEPTVGSLHVSVRTTGTDLDIDGFEVIVAPTMRRAMGSASGSTSGALVLSPGSHIVTLERVAPNCQVTSPHPLAVTVVAGRSLNVFFDIACVATGVTIQASTSGADAPGTHPVFLDGRHVGYVAGNGTLVLTRLAMGSHTIRLPLPDHCSMPGGTEAVIDVRNREVIPVTLNVTCSGAVRRQRIAYDRYVNGLNGQQQWIMFVNPDGSGAVEVALGHSPVWSRDGATLLFSTTNCLDFFYYGYACTDGLSVMNPESRVITELKAGLGGLEPAWAPAGDEIAFTRCCTEGFSRNMDAHLFVTRVDGSQERKIFGGPSANPSWAPDGERIAFGCVLSAGKHSICVIKRDGTGYQQLTPSGLPAWAPAWSPDGTRIAFTILGANDNSRIALISPDGTGIATLADGWKPAWSADGQALVFVRADGLYTMRSDGSNVMRLVTGNVDSPAWRP